MDRNKNLPLFSEKKKDWAKKQLVLDEWRLIFTDLPVGIFKLDLLKVSNLFGGGTLSLVDIRTTIASPNGIGNSKHVLAGHYIAVPIDITIFAS